MGLPIDVAPAGGTWVVRAAGAVLGESRRALRLTEAGHAPVIYFPREDLAMAMLEPAARRSTCPWKGEAEYWSIHGAAGVIANAAWCYPAPKPVAAAIAGHLAFDPACAAVEQV